MRKLYKVLLIPVLCLFLLIACSNKSDIADPSLVDQNENISNAEYSRADDQITKLDVSELAKRIQNGELSAEQVTQAFLNRIEKIDRNGPKLNSIIEINPDALDIAKALDAKFTVDKNLGSLHGIPVLLKANIDTGDKMATSAGSMALAEHYPALDAPLVEKMRAAGAVILGKTNLSEWANFRSTNSVSGWSSLGGQTKNPYVLDRNPCGSSSGSAVAVSAYLAPLAVGTETDGSVVCPSGVNGIVGIKPTVGRVSVRGIIPISATQDTAGAMAKTVAGAAMLFEVMHGQKIEATAPVEMNKIRVGVWRNYFGAENNPRITGIFNTSIAALKNMGVTIVDPIEFPERGPMNDAEYEVLLYEFKDGLNKYLETHNMGYGLEELMLFNQDNADTVMPYFNQEIFEMAQAKGDLNDAEYKTALKVSHVSAQTVLKDLFKQYNLDVIIAPTNQAAWPIDYLNGDRFLLSSSGPSAISGYPNVTVPMGNIMGLPVGLSFMGLEYQDERLIEISAAFEAVTKARLDPEYIPSLERVD